ncbi:MAG: YdeI/OmpD-associated family protein [Saprospiraceae bacterium]|nr:YdeI/OmpD-associated family protein [Saprospiraceae bacterium]
MESENTYHFTSHIGDETWGHCFGVPSIYAEMFKSEDGSRRVVCVLNDSLTLHAAIMPHGNGWVISMNKPNLKKLGLKVGSPVQVEIRKDTSEFGLPMSEEFREVLEQDPEAKGYFDVLTAGKKRSLIHFVTGVKNIDKRIERAFMIAEKLKESKGIIKSNELWGG